MVASQLVRRGITDSAVLRAMSVVARELFVPVGSRQGSYEDGPIPIGFGQTISQPYMVALTCQLAGITPGANVLDVGSGSGYQTAVLAELGARVVGVELIPELAARARESLEAAGYADRVDVHDGDGTLGIEEHAPYQAVVVAAAASRLPETLVEQLEQGGRIVAPLGSARGQWLRRSVATPDGLQTKNVVRCRFVPLVGAGRFGR